MGNFAQELEQEKNRTQQPKGPRWLRVMRRHWKQLNELYMLVIFLVLWLTFPTWIRVVYAFFYPLADFQFGVSDPGFLQHIVYGILCFYAAGAAAWWAIKFSFPQAGHWLDDVFETRAFSQRTFGAGDRQRARILITMYLVLFALAAWCILAVQPGW